MKKPIYKRALLKISGESVGGSKRGIDLDNLFLIADEIAKAHSLGVQLGVAIGGGNIFRGSDAKGWIL